MRLDKFLKVSRLIKRRPLAKEAADRGRILVNDKVAKAATEVRVGDKLQLTIGARQLTVEVLELRPSCAAAEAANLYRVLSDQRLNRSPSADELPDRH